MGVFSHHEPCQACGSSDALARYADGSGYCWSCQTYEKGEQSVSEQVVDFESARDKRRGPFPIEGSPRALNSRRLDAETCRKYGYAYGHDPVSGGPCHLAPYHDAKGKLVAQKVRMPDKTFRFAGNPKSAGLFGQHLWRPGKRVVITEGEVDCLSVAQVLNLKWPVVSVPNGAQAAHRDLAKHVEWLEGFDEIVLCFDQDIHGKNAVEECVNLFTPGKVRIVSLPRKDANDMLVAGESDALRRAVWDAAPYRPECIVTGLSLIDAVLSPPPPSIEYPWSGLDKLLRGQRRGEITTWCGGTGTGKSQLVREVAHALHLHGEPVGVVALEESTRIAALAQVSLQMNQRLHDPVVRATVTDAEIRAAGMKALDSMYFYDHFGSVEAKVLIPKIRFMALALGVRWVVLDHISIMVSGTATEGDERKRIDELMTNLATTVQELDIGLHIVSHLRKAQGTPHEEGGRITLDDLRGSGAIKQVSFNIVAAERNQQHADEDERNVTTLRVLKCRVFGETGVASRLSYSKDTGRITELPPLPADEAADHRASGADDDSPF